MSDAPISPDSPPRDPLVRFLIGCGIVAGVIVALLLIVAVVVGWRLTRDETPGRSEEAFLTGDEERYLRIDLRENDTGLQALFARIDAINEETRSKIFKGTVLEGLPIPHRRARLDEIAPFRAELSTTRSGEWAARAIFSHGVLRLRAAMKLLRFVSGKGRGSATTVEVDGVAVTEIQDERPQGPHFAIASVGNRVLAAASTSRIRSILEANHVPADARAPSFEPLHESAKLPGEDGWVFADDNRFGPVAASLDMTADDTLTIRVALRAGAYDGSETQRREIVAALLRPLPADLVTLDPQDRSPAAGAVTFDGRIADVSKRLGAVVGALSESRRGRPFAIPTPPSPEPPSGPRNGTPGEPTHGETPTRPH